MVLGICDQEAHCTVANIMNSKKAGIIIMEQFNQLHHIPFTDTAGNTGNCASVNEEWQHLGMCDVAIVETGGD